MPLLRRWIPRPVSKVLFSIAALALLPGPAPAPLPPILRQPICAATAADRIFFPEVRLRKLHLVRPDLIPYPIYYEIYC
jgi:hypothetical protein